MLDKVLIEVEGVSKKYCRDLKKSLLYGVRDICNDIIGRSGDYNKLRTDEFWALEDVSFSLRKGESMGLIGRNGAGKTTLLKLINGLIKPTKGRITINGTIGALIALGTGFNPILTGRENTKIAGVVLGLSERQVNEKLDEIMDFSGIGDFIDAPVKSYSSGMLVRLGFSVAIQLSPDILLVDEVLAVGDLAFAVKCHKKITEYRNNGGSMILVSHGMHNVRFHCDRALWLDNAKIMAIGESNSVCNQYEMFVGRESNQKGEIFYFDDSIELRNFSHTEVLKEDEEFIFEFEVKSKRLIEKPIVVFSIFDVKGQHIFKNYSHIDNAELTFTQGITKVKIKYEQMPLANGVYNINLIVHENEINNHLVFCERCFGFEIQREEPILGLLSLKPEWNVESI